MNRFYYYYSLRKAPTSDHQSISNSHPKLKTSAFVRGPAAEMLSLRESAGWS